MSAHVLLNLLNLLGNRDKMRGFFATSLVNSNYKSTNVRIYLSYGIKNYFEISFLK